MNSAASLTEIVYVFADGESVVKVILSIVVLYPTLTIVIVAVSQVNSIFTATNTTITAKEWEWIYFNAKVTQTGLALTNYTFNLADGESDVKAILSVVVLYPVFVIVTVAVPL